MYLGSALRPSGLGCCEMFVVKAIDAIPHYQRPILSIQTASVAKHHYKAPVHKQ